MERNRCASRSGRENRRTDLVFVVLTLLGLVALFGLPFLPQWLLRHYLMTDYAARPPAAAFERAFHRPVPPGVSQLQAAGYVAIGGISVWMSCEATDEAIAAITKGSQRVPDARETASTLFAFWAAEESPGAIGWGGVLFIRDPECYVFGNIIQSVTVIVDRPRRTLYAHWRSI